MIQNPTKTLTEIRHVICERCFTLIAGGLLTILAVLLIGSAANESPTNDETIHLAAGYVYLTTGEYSMELAHPPLGRVLAALPLLSLTIQYTPANRAWAEINQFLWRNAVPGETILFRARLAVITLTILCGGWLVWWTRRNFGAAIALLALTFFVFDPNLIAHGHYVTTDLIAALGIFLALTLWTSFLLEPNWKHLVAAGVGLGLALVSKYSAVFLLLVFPLLYCLAWQYHRGRRFFTWRAAMLVFVVICITAGSVIALTYAPQAITRFRDLRAAGYQSTRFDRLFAAILGSNPAAGRSIAILGRAAGEPFYAYVMGLNDVIKHNADGHRAYLLGRFSNHGWWQYFLVAFLVKTPTAVLLASFLALVSLFFSWRRFHPRLLDLCIALPPMIFFALAMCASINIGIRYILPVYPFLYVCLAFIWVQHSTALLRKARCWVLGGLIVMLCAESLKTYPHYLAFFNWPSGGPVNGPRYLLDSNIDWGQDLPALKHYIDEHGAMPLCTALFGSRYLRQYGVISRDLLATGIPEGVENLSCVVAVSVNFLTGLYVSPYLFAPLRQREPMARIGYSIYVYDLRR